MNPTLLIDADPICYRAAQAAEEELDFSQDLTFIVGNFRRGKDIVRQEIDKLISRFDAGEIVLFFTGTQNFRKEVDPEYKSHRIKRKPAGYLKLKNWCMKQWPSYMEERLEADDLLGIHATSGQYKNFVLCSPDKDLRQIPCRQFDGTNEFDVTPAQGKRKFWEQVLTGDPTDGYKGVVGIGSKRAKEILDKVKDGSYYEAVLAAYKEHNMTEEAMLQTARLAQILQVGQWDGAKKELYLFDK
jgi:DNA polymerase-1